MKKAILIVGIIWIVLSLGAAISEITYGIGQLVDLSAGGVEWKPDVVLGSANIVIGGYYVISIIMTLVLILTRNSKMGKGAGIALGIIAIVLGSLVPGILFIVDSANNRK